MESMVHNPPTQLALALIAVLAAAALGLVTASAADHEPSSSKPASKLSGPLAVLVEVFASVSTATVDYAAASADADSPSGAYRLESWATLAPGLQRLDSRGVVNGKLARHGLDARRIDLEPYEGGDVIPELFRLGDSDHSSLCTISMAVRSRLFIRASYRGKSLERGQLRDQTPIEYVKPIGKETV